MILAIDIGNTTTAFGVFEAKRLAGRFAIATQPGRTPDEIVLQLKALAKTHRLHLRRVSSVILCSVVPRMSAVLIEALGLLGRLPVRVVGQDLQVPLANRYRYPEQVGQDRLVGAYAVWREFGKGGRSRAPRDGIIVDCGTALTIDVVTKTGAYLGGIIAPGLELSLEALAGRTALLPKVDLREPPELLGRDTANSIRSGILHGTAALCDGLIGSLKARYAPGAVVVATGGSTALLMKHCRMLDVQRPHLILQGLAALATAPRSS